MPEDYKYYDLKISSEEFIEQSDSAAKRTRWTMIVLVLASVLIGIGFYNTTPYSFAPEGINALNKFENRPINNLAEQEHKHEPMPLLDSYFGENDFKNTYFEKTYHLSPYYREGNFKGLRHFLCEDIYKPVFPKKRVIHDKDFSLNENPLLDKQRSLKQYLFDNFNPETRKLLEECARGLSLDFPTNLIKFNYLTTDLNKILTDKYLYNEQRFPDDVLKCEKENQEISNHEINNHEEMCHLLAEWKAAQAEDKSKAAMPTPILSSKVKEVDVVRLNRLLLEASFLNINKSSDIIPSGEKLAAREFATHLAFDENVRYLKIPFFDTSIEVNDLGAFGGVGLIIILLLLRFSLSREIKNLNVAFRQTFYKDELVNFYHKLAMRLVLIVPEMEGESVNQALSAGGKYICFLPPLTLSAGVFYDHYSIYTLGLYKSDEVFIHLGIEYFCVGIVWYLSLRCLERLMHIDEIWEDYHLIWDKYREWGIESHELLSRKFELAVEPDLYAAIKRRVHNKSKQGKFADYISILPLIGRLWIVRLITLKNIARLMPFYPMRWGVVWLAEKWRDNADWKNFKAKFTKFVEQSQPSVDNVKSLLELLRKMRKEAKKLKNKTNRLKKELRRLKRKSRISELKRRNKCFPLRNG
ncbi:MAG: hypothetical protein WA584_14085 [Pyrinomonadaceae bacterium]